MTGRQNPVKPVNPVKPGSELVVTIGGIFYYNIKETLNLINRD
jgi:hypothetical protein